MSLRSWRNLRSMVGVVLVMVSCRAQGDVSSPTSGHLNIVCDECVVPPFEEERRAFERSYPKASIHMVLSPADGAIARLLNKDVNYVVSARDFDSNETDFLMKNNLGINSLKVALDGLAILVHATNPVSEMDTDQLARILSGEFRTWRQLGDSLRFPASIGPIRLVHDGLRSSNYHFLRSQVLDKRPLSRNAEVVVGDSSTSATVKIMEYIATHPSAIGYVSTAWLGHHPDYTVRADRIKVLRLTHVDFQKAVDPIPGYIYRGDYPLRRAVYVMSRQESVGLAAGFTAYLTGNDGQKILLDQNLVPAVNPVRLKYE